MTPPMYYSRFSQTTSTFGGNLPHWAQRCATFATFRLADSLPQAKLEQYQAERDEWLRRRGLQSASCCPLRRRGLQSASASRCNNSNGGRCSSPPSDADCSPRLHADADCSPRLHEEERSPRLQEWDEKTIAEYEELFPLRFQKWLDAGYGSCVLRDDRVRTLVEETLRHYDGIRYSLYTYVVMPNHVHVLFMPEEGFDGREIVANWKRYSSRFANRLLGREGQLWQKESYDHLVRNVEEFNAIRSYIRNNDLKLAWDAYAE